MKNDRDFIEDFEQKSFFCHYLTNIIVHFEILDPYTFFCYLFSNIIIMVLKFIFLRD